MKHPNIALITPGSSPFSDSQPVAKQPEGFRAAVRTWSERVLFVAAMILLANGLVQVLELASSRQSTRAGRSAEQRNAAEQNAASFPVAR